MDADNELRVRNNLWSSDLEKLLRKWRNQIQKRKIEHMKLSEAFKRKHYLYGLPASVLGAMATTGAFATFRNCDPNEPSCETEQWIRLFVGMITLSQSALSAFNLFMNYQSKTEKHLTAAENYETLFRAIDAILQTPATARGDPIGTLKEIQNQYDDISKIAMLSVDMAETELKYSIYKGSNSGSNSSSPREITPPRLVAKNQSPKLATKLMSAPPMCHHQPLKPSRMATEPVRAIRSNQIPPRMPALEPIRLPPALISIPEESEGMTEIIDDINNDVDTDETDDEVTIRLDLDKPLEKSRNFHTASLIMKKWLETAAEKSNRKNS